MLLGALFAVSVTGLSLMSVLVAFVGTIVRLRIVRALEPRRLYAPLLSPP